MSEKRRQFLKKAILAGLVVEFGPLLMSSEALAMESGTKTLVSSVGIDPWKGIRKQFRLRNEPVYLNNAGLGPSSNQIIDRYIDELIALETSGETGHARVDWARESISKILGANPKEICFTRNATEGMNIIANGVCLKKGDEIVMTTHEHVGGSIPWVSAANRARAKINLVDLDLTGEENFNLLTAAVTKKTKIMVCSHVTCTTGMVLPIKRLAKWCKEHGIKLCVDGAQALGMMAIDFHELDVDFYTASGHKWAYGPKGTGLLYIAERNLKDLHSIFVGAYSDGEFDLKNQVFVPKQAASRYEFGTTNVSKIGALEESFKFLEELKMDKVSAHGKALVNHLRDRIKDSAVVITPEKDEFYASILTFQIPGKPYQEIQKILGSKGFRTRGIYENDLDAIRISCACYNTEEQLSRLASAIMSIR
jgi:selenocysteine lyase/cysteine desulfurase